MNNEILGIIDQLGRDKGIDKEILIEGLKSAMEAAARKRLETNKPLQTEFNQKTGEIQVFSEKTIVNEVTNSDEEILVKDALAINPEVIVGETLLVQLPIDNFGRIAAQIAKQVIMQKVREAEIDILFNEFQDKQGDLINGIVQRFEHGDIIVDLGKTEGILPRREQVFRETFSRGDRIRAYILDIRKTTRNATVILSRTNVGLIKNLFELEVPEINEGIIEIKGIVREPNGRTKIAVQTNDRDVDAVGACVGMRGMRVQSIVQELRGEKIDIVEYSEDPEVFIRNALSPAKISRIIKNTDTSHMTIIVADDQMSLAIGKKGQNVRLAAKLVKLKIDIKGQSEAPNPLDISGLLTNVKKDSSNINFLEEISAAKGLGEKITAILFEGNIVTIQNVIDHGLKGLVSLPGIGPKKAAAILAFTKELDERGLENENELSDSTEANESTKIMGPSSVNKNDTEDDDELEVPVNQLYGIDPSIINKLMQNGFETLAELSITEKEELAEINGIDEETAMAIIDQAKKQSATDKDSD
jgi:N utilization substance protein A